jgi:hypothetical protein
MAGRRVGDSAGPSYAIVSAAGSVGSGGTCWEIDVKRRTIRFQFDCKSYRFGNRDSSPV